LVLAVIGISLAQWLATNRRLRRFTRRDEQHDSASGATVPTRPQDVQAFGRTSTASSRIPHATGSPGAIAVNPIAGLLQQFRFWSWTAPWPPNWNAGAATCATRSGRPRYCTKRLKSSGRYTGLLSRRGRHRHHRQLSGYRGGFHAAGSWARGKSRTVAAFGAAGYGGRDVFWREPANRAGRPRPLVAASVGPYGAFLADGSEYRGDYRLSEAELMDFHRLRMATLLDAGADLLACETLPASLRRARWRGLLAEFPAGGMPGSASAARDEAHLCHGDCLAELARRG